MSDIIEELRRLGLIEVEERTIASITNGAAEDQGGALMYAFGHIVSSFARPEDAHAADSMDEGRRVLKEILDEAYDGEFVRDLVVFIAEHVAGDYEYTGKATEEQRRIEAGEV